MHDVVAVAYDGLCTFEFGIAVEVFGLPRPEISFPWYRFSVCASERRPIKAMGGISMDVPHGLGRLRDAQTVIVPGWRDIAETPPDDLCQALADAHSRGARLVSICGGAFVLAAAGLLDGKTATTHWMFANELARRFPKVSVQPQMIFTDDGDVLTAAGSAAGIDLCLHIVRKDFGADALFIVSQRLISQQGREGAQSQFMPMPNKTIIDAPVTKVMTWLTADLRRNVSVRSLAVMAHLSERTLHRRFVEFTGMSPREWLTSERIRRARVLLEHSELTLENIAVQVGFGNAETFRKHFKAHVGVSPSVFKRNNEARSSTTSST